MRLKRTVAELFLAILALGCLPVAAQLRPESSQPPEKKPAARPSRIVVETLPDAEVYLDDERQGQTSPAGRLVIGNVKPGQHTLRVTLSGKKDYEEKVTVEAGKDANVTAALSDLPGKILVRSSPGAEVYLDGVRRGTADAAGQFTLTEVPPGLHEVRVSLRGKKDFQQTLEIAAGQQVQADAALTDLVPPAARAGALKRNWKDGLSYVWIPPGSFTMGCSPGDSQCGPNEKPSHGVTLTRGFWIGQTPVTVAAYKRFATETGKDMPAAPPFNADWARDNMPIANVTWEESQDFCRWSGGRLPTEAEWEYAARGGNTETRYGPLDDVAWYADNSGRQRLDSAQMFRDEKANFANRITENGNGGHEVALKRANGFGLYDTLGNVWEWVNDWYDATYYQNSPSQDPSGPSTGQLRGLRGGSWINPPVSVRVSYRPAFRPNLKNGIAGVRCVGEANLP